nr:hypothetical protein SHINE37_60139 [Rhizobiaceae bacterium]
MTVRPAGGLGLLPSPSVREIAGVIPKRKERLRHQGSEGEIPLGVAGTCNRQSGKDEDHGQSSHRPAWHRARERGARTQHRRS